MKNTIRLLTNERVGGWNGTRAAWSIENRVYCYEGNHAKALAFVEPGPDAFALVFYDEAEGSLEKCTCDSSTKILRSAEFGDLPAGFVGISVLKVFGHVSQVKEKEFLIVPTQRFYPGAPITIQVLRPGQYFTENQRRAGFKLLPGQDCIMEHSAPTSAGQQLAKTLFINDGGNLIRQPYA